MAEAQPLPAGEPHTLTVPPNEIKQIWIDKAAIGKSPHVIVIQTTDGKNRLIVGQVSIDGPCHVLNSKTPIPGNAHVCIETTARVWFNREDAQGFYGEPHSVTRLEP